MQVSLIPFIVKFSVNKCVTIKNTHKKNAVSFNEASQKSLKQVTVKFITF